MLKGGLRARAAAAGFVAAWAAFVQPAAAPAEIAPMEQLLAARIRHVFIIYQENRSFDNEFGTFPGANGVWSAEARDHGFAQRNPITGRITTPFRLTDPDVYYEENHRDVQLEAQRDGAMDRFVEAQIRSVMKKRKTTPAQAASVGDESMYHMDCDTIPFLWAYARRFALFDNFFQALRGPSTPSNIEIIAGQNGLTQLARHPEQAVAPNAGPGVPIFSDIDPFFAPFSHPAPPHQINQTYATVLLELMESDATKAVVDNDDVIQDEHFIVARGRLPVPWRWYQEGYASPADPDRHGFIAHHHAPQYFGYVMRNEIMRRNLMDLTAFYTDLARRRLPDRGVFYIKGGARNVLGLRPANPDPFVQQYYLGDDDHPGYGDAHLSEAFVASAVSAVAASPYWNDSAIIIAWDDSGGFWDHVPPHKWEMCPDGHPCGDGARVPAIVISPFARSGAIVHELSDQVSILKFIETVFALPALASLPDEKPYLPLGPRDAVPGLGNLAGAFDLGRLARVRPPLAPDLAIFSDRAIRTVPPPLGCAAIGVRPVPPPPGLSDAPPPGFTPRPFATNPNVH